jgi:hypothetical protein
MEGEKMIQPTTEYYIQSIEDFWNFQQDNNIKDKDVPDFNWDYDEEVFSGIYELLDKHPGKWMLRDDPENKTIVISKLKEN